MFQTPSTIHKVQTLVDGGNKLEVITRELSPDEMTALFSLKGREGWFLFKENEITEMEVKDLPAVEEFQKKTPSKRLRDLLWIYHNKSKSKLTFEEFYRSYYERKCLEIKSKIDELDE